MMRMLRMPLHARRMLYLGICLLILSTLPARPAQAGATVTQIVDNTMAQFTDGSFQRTALTATLGTGIPNDETGSVQLMPVSVLDQWSPLPFDIPERLSGPSTVAIDNHIFVIGGTSTEGGSQQPTKKVWTSTVNTETGAPDTWLAEPDLPAVQTSSQTRPNLTTPVAERAAAAATAVRTGPNSGYIYVIGGSVKPSGAVVSITSFAVSIGTVVNGRISKWESPEGARVPAASPLYGQIGVQSASAVSVTIGDKTYIYLFGGLQRYIEGSRVVELGSRKAWYALVGSNGQLVKPSAPSTAGWDELADIPLTDTGDSTGLWDGAAIAANNVKESDTTNQYAVYLMGGRTQPGSNPQYNNIVYRALINNSNGTLTWQTDNPPLTMPEARNGMAGVAFNSVFYVTGGRPLGGQPQKAMLTSYVEDDMKLPIIGTSGSNFYSSLEVMPKARAHHGSVVVTASYDTDGKPNSAYVYVIAGEGSSDPSDTDPLDDLGSKDVIYGKINLSNDSGQNFTFPKDGWYYSSPHNTLFNDAEVKEINWSTEIASGQDIRVEYRVSNPSTGNCTLSNAFDGATWQVVDGADSDGTFSRNGLNTETLPAGLRARCFQYRAKLSTSASDTSPSLLLISLQVKIPGSPDLTVKTLAPRYGLNGKTLIGIQVEIYNHNSEQTTLAANLTEKGDGVFYVELCIFAPGETATPPTLPLSDANHQCSDAYVEINKKDMGKDVTLPVTQWCRTRAENTCQPVDLLTLFPVPGDYTLFAAVDSYDYVTEEPTSPAEQNNVSEPVIVRVYEDGGVGYGLNLAIIRR